MTPATAVSYLPRASKLGCKFHRNNDIPRFNRFTGDDINVLRQVADRCAGRVRVKVPVAFTPPSAPIEDFAPIIAHRRRILLLAATSVLEVSKTKAPAPAPETEDTSVVVLLEA